MTNINLKQHDSSRQGSAKQDAAKQGSPQEGSPQEVFAVFLKLGLTSFGGPAAHLGYFRNELVQRRQWIDEQGYASLVALCQFLPGPGSSQLSFALGLLRGGPLGALAAALAFALPSALLLIAFAYGAAAFGGPVGQGIIAGLKIVAVAVVAHAVWGMAKHLCPDRARLAIALGAALVVLGVGGSLAQVSAIGAGALAGLALCRGGGAMVADARRLPVSRRAAVISLSLFGLLLIGLPLVVAAVPIQGLAVFDAFYRAGALVFGGGHVVLPLLEVEVVHRGWVTADQFLAGYGLAQAIPGPLFTFAAYLGTVLGTEPNGLAGAALALGAIFLPGYLLLVGALPFWHRFCAGDNNQALIRGANAAVVGILAAALYDPVFTSAIVSLAALALALLCLGLLMIWKAPPWMVVMVAALGGVLIELLL
jgi:chromate transporter